jgi:NadR type nicotinamide-nucleotide adenylyltransferase
MSVGIVLGTFLPFHKGHEMLINFAKNYPGCDNLVVILSSRSFEPITGLMRWLALKSTFEDVYIYHHEDDNAPQNPKSENDVEFWDYWKKVIRRSMWSFEETDPCFVFSSESYGSKVASLFENCRHIMFDFNREHQQVSGTVIRNNPLVFHDSLNIHMARYLKKQFVFFGAESVGKTTFTNDVAEYFNANITVEYARPYLMSLEDKTVTEEKMVDIFNGQHALEDMDRNTLSGKILSFMDTDILSTFGYAEMMGMDSSNFENFKLNTADRVYFVLGQEEVSFEEDILRYGGDRRESSDEFWLDLLKRYGVKEENIHYVTGEFFQRQHYVKSVVLEHLDKQFYFEREV